MRAFFLVFPSQQILKAQLKQRADERPQKTATVTNYLVARATETKTKTRAGLRQVNGRTKSRRSRLDTDTSGGGGLLPSITGLASRSWRIFLTRRD